MIVVSLIAVALGAIAQRISGLGFSMLVGPVLVLTFGPFEGILLVNILGAFVSLVLIIRLWRSIVWHYFSKLLIPALPTIVLGSLVSVWLDSDLLQLLVGAMVFLGLTVSLRTASGGHRFDVGKNLTAAGLASGFTSSTAGIGGPPMGIYGILTGWEPRQFAATLQPFFVSLGTLSFSTKVAFSGEPPDIPLWLWPVLVAVTLVGLLIGETLTNKVSSHHGRQVVILVCYLGASAAIVDAAIALAAGA